MSGPPWWMTPETAEDRWEAAAGRAWPSLTQADLDDLRTGREWRPEYCRELGADEVFARGLVSKAEDPT